MFAARLQAYLPNGAAAGELLRPISWEASVVHNDAGGIIVDYSTLAAGGPLIQRPLKDGLEVALEVWNGSAWVESRGCRFLRVKQNQVDRADGAQVYRVQFVSYGWLLKMARLFGGTFTNGVRTFVAPKAGPLFSSILTENASRSGVPMAIVGGGTNDAGGAAWPTLPDQKFKYGTDYFSLLRGLQEAGVVDWTTQARGVYLYLPDSTSLSPDLSETVKLSLGTDITEAPAEETMETTIGRVGVSADAGGTVLVTEPLAPNAHGVWEGHLAVGQVADEAAAISMGQAELERQAKARQQFTHELVLHESAKIPLVDYWPGCWITAPTNVDAEKVRLQQITIGFGKDGFRASVVLNDRLTETDLRRARTLGALAGGQVGSGGAPPPVAVDPEASRIPSTPTNLDVVAGLSFTGPTPRGVVTATWDPVSTATDSGALVISGYEFQYSLDGGPWQTISTPEVNATVTDLEPGATVDTRVQAIGARTTYPSAWSAIETVVVSGDTTAPPIPTTPGASSATMIVTIAWDGLLAGPIPVDFAYVEIAIGSTAAPTTVRGVLTRAGVLQVTAQSLGVLIGDTVWARLRSVDSSGNSSSYSDEVSVVVVGVEGPDLEADSVTANAMAAGAIDGMIITGATLRTSASNPRVEMNSAGLAAYNAGGTKTLDVNAATGDVSIIGDLSATGTGGSIFAGSNNANVPGFWVGDGVRDRVTMQVTGGAPGVYTWDSAGTVRMSLFTNGTSSSMVFRNSSGVEVLRINDATIQHRYTSGRLSLEESQGTLLVYADTATFPDIFRTYWDAANSLKRVYIGHESSPVANFNVWGDNMSIRSTSGSGGVVELSSRGTTGIQMRAYDSSGTVIRGYADFSTTRMWIGQYGAAGVLASRLNLEAGDAQLFSSDTSGNVWLASGTSSGKIFLRLGGTSASSGRVVEISDSDTIMADFDSAGMHLYSAAAIPGDNLVRRSSDARIGFSSSSRRWKTDIEAHVISLDAMRALQPRSWRDKAEAEENPETTNRYVGLVAEEVHEAGLLEAVMYDPDGTPRNLVDRALIAGLIEWNKNLEARLEALESGGSGTSKIRTARAATLAVTEATSTGDVKAIPAPGPEPKKPEPMPKGKSHRPEVPPDHVPERTMARSGEVVAEPTETAKPSRNAAPTHKEKTDE